MKRQLITKKLIILALLFMASWVNAQTTKYVKKIGLGSKDGTSWANASDDIQKMLNISGVTKVWVAGGTYKPTRKANATGTLTTGNLDNAFVLPVGVKIYGGFSGTETTLTDRISGTNETILSGDLDNDNAISTGDAYHVVILVSTVRIASDTGLDGVTITGGNARLPSSSITVSGQGISTVNGGGVYAVSSSNNDFSPAFTNCNIRGNSAQKSGGGFFFKSSKSKPVFTNCKISGNKALTENGGGVYSSDTGTVGITSMVY